MIKALFYTSIGAISSATHHQYRRHMGTALAIFLIFMLVVMLQQVQVVSFAPESNRDRFRMSSG